MISEEHQCLWEHLRKLSMTIMLLCQHRLEVNTTLAFCLSLIKISLSQDVQFFSITKWVHGLFLFVLNLFLSEVSMYLPIILSPCLHLIFVTCIGACRCRSFGWWHRSNGNCDEVGEGPSRNICRHWWSGHSNSRDKGTDISSYFH